MSVRAAADVQVAADVKSGPIGSRVTVAEGDGVAEYRGPLTITPPSDKHRLDAEVVMGTGRKGIELKAMTRMRCRVAGCVAWNLATFSAALATFPESSQVLASKP